ncbi:MAG: 50S ribosomal protein L3 N(5)-glutamine methyltransferase [Gammaproteobacteria bacterium]
MVNTINYQDICNELYTIRDMIRWSASLFAANPLFYGHGTDNPWDEALDLVMQTLKITDEHIDMLLDARLTKQEKNHLLTLIQQRIEQRIPVPYLTHQARFADLNFYIDERALIPRSPIAELIEASFAPWIDADKITTVLDLCTGSGCIALATAVYLANPDVMIDAVDISTDALDVATINVATFGLEDQVNIIQSDLFNALKGRKYDVIISNPPYVDAAEMAALPAEYRHEPTLALAAGDDGLAIVHHILNQAAAHLTEQGILIVEVGASAEALMAAYPQLPFIWLDFERGGDGVFLLYKGDLAAL